MSGRRIRLCQEAVSPVVGALLMVAITVVLAAALIAGTQHLGGDTGRAEFATVDVLDVPGTLTAATNDGLVLVQHRGGHAFAVRDYAWTVGGQPVRVLESDGAGCGLAEAAGWDVGQWVCLAEDGTDVAPGSLHLRVVHKSTKSIVYDELVVVR